MHIYLIKILIRFIILTITWTILRNRWLKILVEDVSNPSANTSECIFMLLISLIPVFRDIVILAFVFGIFTPKEKINKY